MKNISWIHISVLFTSSIVSYNAFSMGASLTAGQAYYASVKKQQQNTADKKDDEAPAKEVEEKVSKEEQKQINWAEEVRALFALYHRASSYALGNFSASSNFSPNGAWGLAVAKAISKLGDSSHMLTKAPSEILAYCPKFNKISATEKHMVWTTVVEAMAFAESSYKTSLTYRENFGALSTGLLQISQASARNHGGHCAGATTDKLKNPGFNLQCGVQILENQLKAKGKLEFAGKRNFYYWSVLSKDLNPSGHKRFKSRLGYLIAKAPQRWPMKCELPAKLH